MPAQSHRSADLRSSEAMHAAGKKLTEMDQALAEVSGEVATLDERKAALLSQLAQVDAQLAQAHARKVQPRLQLKFFPLGQRPADCTHAEVKHLTHLCSLVTAGCFVIGKWLSQLLQYMRFCTRSGYAAYRHDGYGWCRLLCCRLHQQCYQLHFCLRCCLVAVLLQSL